jgi:hypothetical protein
VILIAIRAMIRVHDHEVVHEVEAVTEAEALIEKGIE